MFLLGILNRDVRGFSEGIFSICIEIRRYEIVKERKCGEVALFRNNIQLGDEQGKFTVRRSNPPQAGKLSSLIEMKT